MKVYVFPGQGSQFIGMGKNLFSKYPELVSIADNILGYSIEELCVNDKENKLNLTEYTQPALFIVNALMYKEKIAEEGEVPDFVAGHSLGEYNALYAADVFDFVTGVKLVKKRGELMGKAKNGSMAAILGFDEEQIKSIISETGLDAIDIANLNSAYQVVISGRETDIDRAISVFEANGAKRCVKLNVSGAFHSRYMKEAAREFETYITQFTFGKPKIPVISNAYARPYEQDRIRETLVKQMTSSVKWTESIRYLMGKENIKFEQVGPGYVLSGLIQSIKRECKPLAINEQEGTITKKFTAETLGNESFKKDYGVKYSYVAGGMYKGIASKELVEAMAKKKMLSFFGTGGLNLSIIEENLIYLKEKLGDKHPFGVNVICDQRDLEREEKIVDLLLKYKIRCIEAAAYIVITPALVRYRVKGMHRNKEGNIEAPNKIIAKLSRPEVAEAFLHPAPERIIKKLLEDNKITKEEAMLAREVPMAQDICVETDSGGHTDRSVAYAVFPAIKKIGKQLQKNYTMELRFGAAGGLGTPESIAASFLLGADFVVTGSVNQCTVEAGTSDLVKDLLQNINVQDTDYVPAADMFEFGAKAQVLKKGVLFPARANKMYECYTRYETIEEIDMRSRKQLEKYSGMSIEDVYERVKCHYKQDKIALLEKDPKKKMASIFKWYFSMSSKVAISGEASRVVDFQVPCGPALGAFNQWVKGKGLEDWRDRKVAEIGEVLMQETARYLENFYNHNK